VLLVRHGQSMHNISDVHAFGDSGADATLYDAPLSSLGESQAAGLAGHALLATAEHAVVSPLTRAIQTMVGAFPAASARGAAGVSPPCTVWHVMAEHLTDSCDIGSGAATLAASWPTLDFSALPEVWWYIDDECSASDALDSRRQYRECGFMESEAAVNSRVDAFVAALRARPERVIAAFGHSDFFNLVMERHCGIEDYWMDNCEVYALELPPATALD